ncbi:hypothetical protein FRB95_004847 [Tulasnella sp. JGI-2019a]|nr:hypothetical protein FRB95_004847 [Tulasnella sp. JGI-2019a]
MVSSPVSPTTVMEWTVPSPVGKSIARMPPSLAVRTPSPLLPASTPSGAADEPDDDIASELVKLESLRKNLKLNLTLRPLRNATPPTNLSLNQKSPNPATLITFRSSDLLPPRGSSNGGKSTSTGAEETNRDSTGSSTLASGGAAPVTPSISTAPYHAPQEAPLDDISDYIRTYMPSQPSSPLVTLPPTPHAQTAPNAIAPSTLFQLLDVSCSTNQPLVLDTRPTPAFLECRLSSSINLAIPTLILKRYHKYMASETPPLSSVHALKRFVTTEEGKEEWDRILGTQPAAEDGNGRETEMRPGNWDGNIIVYDQDMDTTDPLAAAMMSNPDSVSPSAPIITSWLLLSVLASLQASNPDQVPGCIWWLEGGLSAARADASDGPNCQHFISQDGKNGAVVSGMCDETALQTNSSRIEVTDPPNMPLSSSHTMQPRSVGEVGALGAASAADRRGSGGQSSGGSLDGAPLGGLSGFKKNAPAAGASGASQHRSKHVPLALNLKPERHKPIVIETSSANDLSQPTSEATMSSSSESSPHSHVDLNTPSHDPSPPPSLALGAPPRLPRLKLADIPGVASPPSAIPADSQKQEEMPHPRQPGGVTSYGFPGLLDMTPSPSPSTAAGYLPFPRTPTARSRSNTDNMLPKLGKLDTKGKDRLAISIAPINTTASSSHHLPSASASIPNNTPPFDRPLPNIPTENSTTNTSAAQHPQQSIAMPPKLSLRTVPIKAASLGAPIPSPKVASFGLRLKLPPSPNRTTFNGGGVPAGMSPVMSPMSGTSVFFTPVQTPADFNTLYPFTPAESSHQSQPFQYLGLQPPSPLTPLTARPPHSPASSIMTNESEGVPAFAISTVLPGFLFLGPELTTSDQVEELKGLGVKRVLNMAMECDAEDYGLDLKRSFERYLKVPMRDNIEEDRVTKGLRDVCRYIDDARLHSSAVYVHCKAGKSRSVTAVMAYLIHANHWPLSRAYAYVMGRRKGVSPNIGFVSELMKFEEYELGGKSIGVVPESEMSGEEGSTAPNTRRAPANVRDSMPPTFHHGHSQSVIDGTMIGTSMIGVPVSAGGITGVVGAGEEMEVKDGQGRYRHARRAPVNEQTLQPLRRVSKAGLESSWAEQ